jgi:hypothetical protein
VDFYEIEERETRTGSIEVYPSFMLGYGYQKDLMIRGSAFYAIWDEAAGLWSRNEGRAHQIIDDDINARAEVLRKTQDKSVKAMTLRRFRTRSLDEFQRYCKVAPDRYEQLDQVLTFANTPPKREDHSSQRLSYSLEEGDISAYDELMGRLYDPDERLKLEWAVGALIAGDAKEIQKFIVLYGEGGTGKGTFLGILEQLFSGYWMPFDARELTSSNNRFAAAAFASGALVGIQNDGDLSHIEDSSLLNTIVSHESMVIEEKWKTPYQAKVNTFLFLGTNQAVRVNHAKSGLIRRLIDVHPSGKTFPVVEYRRLVRRIPFEIGAIAHHCLGEYRRVGKERYADYRPRDMMVRTDFFFNFLLEYFDVLKDEDGITLKAAWALYKEYFQESEARYKLSLNAFRDELKNYYRHFYERDRVNGIQVKSLYKGFKTEKLNTFAAVEKNTPYLVLDETISLIDTDLADCPAQYANEDENPAIKWVNVKTTLADLDTTRMHYVKPPPRRVVIDFDLRGDDGEKSLERNLEAAITWPPTYAEYSKSGRGVHLHYDYVGDVSRLSRVFDDGIEVKVFPGDSSLRRRLSRCNNIPVANLHDGLPLKEQRVIDQQTMQSERGLRTLILRNLNKEIHAGTKPSIDFIHKILDDAYNSGMQYDVTDMRQRILAFAANSTNQSEYCVRKMMDMKFSSESEPEIAPEAKDGRLVFYDVEVFPNLLVICWKFKGEDADVVPMINPTPLEVEALVEMNLVGFYNRRYDNHILYARMMGYSNEQIFQLSQRLIVKNERNAYFGAAYDLSYADIWEFSSKRQSLKLFQIELGLNHKELALPWDQPVPPEKVQMVVDYCVNDVKTTEQVFNDREQDFVARQMLAALSGLPVMATTYSHTAKIVFGDEKKPQADFVYTDLSGMFPGYVYDFGTSTYKGEVVGEGGYVYAEPGIYTNVAVLDIASMHPTSIRELNLFGPYTKNFTALMDARLAIKRRDYNTARRLLDGKLEPYLGSDEDAEALAYALKIIINIVYGLTSASFENQFRDVRNKDNIVAKRGALFMIDLKNEVQARGYQVIHIKTDSIKIPDADPSIIEFVKKFGETAGYTFEHEATYSKFCLVNDAVYIAKTPLGQWKAVGAQFQHPYVFKTLFSHDQIVFADYCETRSVTGGAALYLDFGDDPQFIGRAGSFVPVLEGTGGGKLLRGKDGVFHSAAGAKGYLWKEAITVQELGLEGDIDQSYFRKLVDAAAKAVSGFGDLEWFTS